MHSFFYLFCLLAASWEWNIYYYYYLLASNYLRVDSLSERKKNIGILLQSSDIVTIVVSGKSI